MVTIKTSRLILRQWQDSDLAPFAALNADPRVREFFPGLMSREESDHSVKLASDHIARCGWGFWAASLIETGEFIGFIGLEDVYFQAHFTPAVEIGWRLAFNHWGKGYATEGAKAALKYGFETLKLDQIVSFTTMGNMRSRHVMEKIGMHHLTQDDFDHPKLSEGHPLRKHVLYRMSSHDWFSLCHKDQKYVYKPYSTAFPNLFKKEKDNLELSMEKADAVDIIDCLNTNYDIAVTALTFLPIGADINASVYKAETRDGPSYFVKLKRGHGYDMSVALLALLQASGIKQIIPPIKATDGKLTKHIDGFTLTVYPFVDGQNGLCCHLTDDQWVTLGKVLKQIHAFDMPSSLKDHLRKETYAPKWRKAVRSFDAHIDGNPTGDETALKLQAFMKEHRAIIHHLVNRAEFLGQKIQEQSPEFVLCHSDIHGGNVLIDRNGTIYIVDWDNPIMAPKERDLMFIGGGVANVWNDPREEEFFYNGYGKTEINEIILAYYRYERIVEDIAEYGQALLLTQVGGKARLDMYKQFIDMFQLGGVVDIALKTDEKLMRRNA